MPRLSIVIPHWPLDAETDDALRRCVASFPPECERIVVVNDGTGFARNANIGLRLASGDVGARPPYRGPHNRKAARPPPLAG